MPSFGGLRLLPNREFTVKTCVLFSLFLVPFLSAACVSFPATSFAPAVPSPAAEPATAASADWQTYTNHLGFSIQYPATWSQEELPQQAGETIHTVTLQGTEGGVDL